MAVTVCRLIKRVRMKSAYVTGYFYYYVNARMCYYMGSTQIWAAREYWLHILTYTAID